VLIMRLHIPRVIPGWGASRQLTPAITGFIPNGPGHDVAIEDSDPNWEAAFASFSLHPVCVEPRYKIFTGVQFATGVSTREHTDKASKGFVHVRCNVMLKKPKLGGNPIIDGEVVDVNQHDLWLCLASMEEHGSEPVYGSRRVIKSFGGLVPLEQVHRIINTENITCVTK